MKIINKYFSIICLGMCFLSPGPILGGETHNAIHSFDEARIKELMESGADFNEKDQDGDTPLHVLAQNCTVLSCVYFAELLVEAGAKVSASNNRGNTPLHQIYLTQENKNPAYDIDRVFALVHFIDVLIKAGADINAKNNNKETPLLLFLKYGYIPIVNQGKYQIVKKLIEMGADVNAQSKKEGYFPLYFVSQWRYGLAIAELLLKSGAKVNLLTKQGRNALFIPCMLGHTETVRLFIEAGAKVNTQDEEGRTPLIYSVYGWSFYFYDYNDMDLRKSYSHLDIMELLFQSGAKLDYQDRYGKTALIYAADSGKVASVWALLELNADFHIEDASGKTALEYAKEKKHYGVVYHLEKAQSL